MPQKADVRLLLPETFVGTPSGILQVVDGRNLLHNDEILWSGSGTSQGPWVVKTGAPWVRRADWDAAKKIQPGDTWHVLDGDTYAGEDWTYEGGIVAEGQLDVALLSIGRKNRRRALEIGDGLTYVPGVAPSMQMENIFAGDETFALPTLTRDRKGRITELESSFIGGDYIRGLALTYENSTTVGLEPGAAYIPSLGGVVEVASKLTGTRLTGNNALYYAYLYETNGVGQLTLTTDPPTVAYLGTAKTRTGYQSMRYLGMLRNDAAGNLLSFGVEASGGSVFYMYSQPVLIATPAAATVTNVDISSTAVDPTVRLISASTRTVYMQALRVSGTSFAEVGYRPDVTTPQLKIFDTGNIGSVFCRVSPLQEARMNSAAGTSVSFYLFGYYERR